jgi:hypothetical protein
MDHPIRVMTVGSRAGRLPGEMATSDFERDPRPEEEQSPVGSELIGVKLTLLLGIGFLAVLAAFFLIGPVVGRDARAPRSRRRGDPGPRQGDPPG